MTLIAAFLCVFVPLCLGALTYFGLYATLATSEIGAG